MATKTSKKADIYKLYADALASLNKKQYPKTQKLLSQIKQDFPTKTDVLARVDLLLRVCDTRIDAAASKGPASSEEAYDLGVLHHNQGLYDDALKLFEKAQKLGKGETDHIHYAIAATEASLGNTQNALKNLKSAIKDNPQNRIFARNDPDFELLARNKEFAQVLSPES